MKIKLYLIAGLVCISYFKLVDSHAAIKDSVGKETAGGKLVILHKVERKESVYSVAKKYNVHADDILKANPDAQKGLKTGQIIKIPTQRKLTWAESHTGANKSNAKVHTVQSGQTLFAIAKIHNIKVEQIKTWNKLHTDALHDGQQLIVSEETKVAPTIKTEKKAEAAPKQQSNKLHVVAPGQTLYSIAKTYNVSVDDLRKWNNLADQDVPAGRELVISDEPIAKTAHKQAEKKAEVHEEKANAPLETGHSTNVVTPTDTNKSSTTSNTSGYQRIVEQGLAEVINESNDMKKHLCLHRTAPVGTLLQVKNELNGNSIFVRVIGKLPDTGMNDKIVVKVSYKAYERLGANSKRFPVEVSYPAP